MPSHYAQTVIGASITPNYADGFLLCADLSASYMIFIGKFLMLMTLTSDFAPFDWSSFRGGRANQFIMEYAE